MVVAADRYLAEDAADLIVVSYEPLPAGRRHRRGPGSPAPRARRRARQRGRELRRRATATPRRDRRGAARARARPVHRAVGLHAAGGPRRAGPLGRPRRSRLRIWTSTQTSTGVRAAVAAKLDLALAEVDVITPDVGGGFGVKIVHPWPEEVLVPWAAQAARQAGQVHRGPARALHRQRARARPGASRHGSGSTTTAGCSGWTCGSGTTTAPTCPYGLIVPIITSTQLLGPYKPRRLPGRVRLAVHQHRDRHAVPGRRPAAGRFVMERTMDAIAAAARPGPGRGAASATSSSPTRCPTTRG